VRYDHILITGGAGFIGCNMADSLLQAGHHVTLFDNLTRPGTALNLEWLNQRHTGQRFKFVWGDIRDYKALNQAMDGAEVVYHLAAQTAVTRSVTGPREDFEINALGTFNVLESARNFRRPPIVVYASTNKVYGALTEAHVIEESSRYVLPDLPQGVDEQWPIDFHSPYGCSKGAADQYVRDYARIYGMRTVVMRQSCIYGQRQFGVEDQGWVAWFVIAAIMGKPLTVFGNGKQVRDLLHINDVIMAWSAAVDQIDTTAGQIYNIGGGPANAISIWVEFGSLLTDLLKKQIQPASFQQWRPGDQPVFVSNTHRAKTDFGWEPTINIRAGGASLIEWVSDSQDTVVAALGAQ
jgi:CDP-paratose 2-epimerase